MIEQVTISGSSLLSQADYDKETQVLNVTFNSGGTYEYKNVPEFIFEDFKKAASKGEYYNRVIKSKYS